MSKELILTFAPGGDSSLKRGIKQIKVNIFINGLFIMSDLSRSACWMVELQLPPYLYNVRVWGAASDSFCNLPKPTSSNSRSVEVRKEARFELLSQALFFVVIFKPLSPLSVAFHCGLFGTARTLYPADMVT